MVARRLAVAMLVFGAALPQARAVTPKTEYMIGMLECALRGIGIEDGGDVHDVSCEFEPGREMAQSYFGVAEILPGSTLATSGIPMQWLVFAARRDSGPGVLGGDYERSGERLGFGFGRDALVRGKGPRIVLQPVAGRRGKNGKAASEVVGLELRSLGD